MKTTVMDIINKTVKNKVEKSAKHVVPHKTVQVIDVHLGKIAIHKDGFPMAALELSDGSVLCTLVPAFRGYCVHLDASIDPTSKDSHGEIAASEVLGLNNLFDARLGTSNRFGSQTNVYKPTMKFELYHALAVDTIHKGLNRLSGKGRRLPGISEEDEVLYRFVDDDADYDLGDGRQLPFWQATRLDILLAYAIRYMNPLLYQDFTRPTREDIRERLTTYTDEANSATNPEDKKYARRKADLLDRTIEEHKEFSSTSDEENSDA